MKRLFFSLMVITLLVGMSFSAMAEGGVCPGIDNAEIPVDMTIAPWTEVEFAGEFDFKEVNFCTDSFTDYRLWYINSKIFANPAHDGASKALLPEEANGQTWADVVNTTHVNDGTEGLNPVLKVKTNTKVDIELQFKGDGDRIIVSPAALELQDLNWPTELPTMIAIWAYGAGALHNPGGNVMDQYVGHFGQKVMLNTGPIVDSAEFTINGPAQLEYHLDAGILFDSNFWHYAADDYRAKIVCTVAYPETN